MIEDAQPSSSNVIIVKPPELLKCSGCNFETPDPTKYRQHLAAIRHCDKCDKSFCGSNSSRDFKTHQKKHMKPEPVCDICGKTFKYHSRVKQHKLMGPCGRKWIYSLCIKMKLSMNWNNWLLNEIKFSAENQELLSRKSISWKHVRSNLSSSFIELNKSWCGSTGLEFSVKSQCRNIQDFLPLRFSVNSISGILEVKKLPFSHI